MNKTSIIYIAGHRGLVGSAIIEALRRKGYSNLITRSHAELDLTNQQEVGAFFEKEKPEYVFLAAAKVGGIMANNTMRAQFIYENIQIQNNVIHSAWETGVKKLLFLLITEVLNGYVESVDLVHGQRRASHNLVVRHREYLRIEQLLATSSFASQTLDIRGHKQDFYRQEC